MRELDTPRRPSWMREALCPEVDTEVFFPEKGGDTQAARRICALCPVATECLDYAVVNHIEEGIWGGTNHKARQRIRRAAA